MKNKVIRVNSKEQLKYLYGHSAMTWEGLQTNEENLQNVIDFTASNKNADIYVVSGEYMNKVFNLKNANAYPSSLNIVAIIEYKGLAMNYGARWFDDIVDNNARRGGKKINQI